MVRFSYRMVPEVYQVFWAGMAAGEFINDARDRGRQLSQARQPLAGCGGRCQTSSRRWCQTVRYPTGWVVDARHGTDSDSARRALRRRSCSTGSAPRTASGAC